MEISYRLLSTRVPDQWRSICPCMTVLSPVRGQSSRVQCTSVWITICLSPVDCSPTKRSSTLPTGSLEYVRSARIGEAHHSQSSFPQHCLHTLDSQLGTGGWCVRKRNPRKTWIPDLVEGLGIICVLPALPGQENAAARILQRKAAWGAARQHSTVRGDRHRCATGMAHRVYAGLHLVGISESCDANSVRRGN